MCVDRGPWERPLLSACSDDSGYGQFLPVLQSGGLSRGREVCAKQPAKAQGARTPKEKTGGSSLKRNGLSQRLRDRSVSWVTPPSPRPAFLALESGGTRGGVGAPAGGAVGDSVLIGPVQMGGGLVPQGCV